MCSTHITGGSVGEGKSGMLFFFSHNGRYILKTLKRDEFALFRRILPSYCAHMGRHARATLLPWFYGMYKLQVPGHPVYHLIVMSNVFFTKVPITEKFDLKGSTLGRWCAPDSDSSVRGRGVSTCSCVSGESQGDDA